MTVFQEHHLGLVRYWAFRLAGPLEVEELEAVGNEILVRALSEYDETRGASVTTWLTNRIKHGLVDHIRHELGRGTRTQEFTRASRWVKSVTSLDAEVSFDDGDGNTTLHDVLVDPRLDPHRSAEAADLMRKIGELPPKERLVMTRVVQGYKVAEIGEELGVTESRVSQIRTSAMKKLEAFL